MSSPIPVHSPQTNVASFTFRNRTFRFFIKNPNDVIQQHHAAGTFYELKELMLLDDYIPIGAWIVDVGANVGNHTIYFASRPTAYVLALEPNPEAIDILRKNVALNGCTQVDLSKLGMGIGAEPGEFTLHPPTMANNLGATSLEASKPDDASTVSVVTLDEVALNLKHINLLKIDVEGMEMEVLMGAQQCIEKFRPAIYIEVQAKNVRAFSQWAQLHHYRIEKSFYPYLSIWYYVCVPA